MDFGWLTHPDWLTHFEVTAGALALGAIIGMTYGLVAVGLVLVYRTSRIINFAQSALGTIGAAFAGIAVLEWGLGFWVALAIALVVSAGVAAGSEMLIVRRLRNAPALIGVIATLGLSAVVLTFSSLINSQVTAGATFPTPTGLPTWHVGAETINPSAFAMLFGAPVVVLALAYFLRRGWFGLAMRAASTNPEAAQMAGVNANGMSTLAWAIAGGLAAFTAVLVLGGRGYTGGDFLGNGLFLRALAAAVIARMSSISVAMIAGIGVGIIEQLLLWNYPTTGLVEVILFVIILVALLLQRQRFDRRESKGSWTVIKNWPPLPESYRKISAIRNMRWAVFGVLLAIGVAIPILVSNANAVSFTFILVMTTVGLSVAVVAGLSGQLSLGQFALAGIGAVVSYYVTRDSGTFVLGFVAGGLGAAAASLVIGLPALRIRGPMLAVTTLGFAIVTGGWLLTQPWALGAGRSQDPPSLFGISFDTQRAYYVIALVMLLITVFFARNVWKSGLGLRMRAVRDNEDSARAFTVNPTLVKLQAFTVSGFLAGLAGAVYGGSFNLLTVDAFATQRSIDAAASAVLGGLGIMFGPFLGALFIVGIPIIPDVFHIPPLDLFEMLGLAAGWLIIVVLVPGGFASGIVNIRNAIANGIARRHGLDPEAEWDAGAGEATVEMRTRIELPAPGPRPVPPGDVILRTRDITKRYGGLHAVDHVSLELRAGETLGLIGPNGAGKTTLFELISGFTHPNGGTVEFLGRDITGLSPSRRSQLGLIRSFQDAALFPTLTVLDCVRLSLERTAPTRFAGAFIGLGGADRRKEARARELVEMMGLHRYRDKQTAELSTGTRRVAELTCMIALDPIVLLLDEPSSGIAQRETEMLGEVLRRLADQLQLTIVLIEHDIPLVMSMSDRVIAMETGRIIADGLPADVRNDPRVIESYLGGDIRAIERSTVPAPTGAAE